MSFQESTPNQLWLLQFKELCKDQSKEWLQSKLLSKGLPQFNSQSTTLHNQRHSNKRDLSQTLFITSSRLSRSHWESKDNLDPQSQLKWSNKIETNHTFLKLWTLRSNSHSSQRLRDLLMPPSHLEKELSQTELQWTNWTTLLPLTLAWEDQIRASLQLTTEWSNRDQCQTSCQRRSQFASSRLSSTVARTSSTSRCSKDNCQRTSWRTSAENSTWAREPSSDFWNKLTNRSTLELVGPQ